jgi:hypothetical protein
MTDTATTVAPEWDDTQQCTYGGRQWRIHKPRTVWGGPIRKGVRLQVLTDHGWHTLKSSESSSQHTIDSLKKWVVSGVETGMRCFSDDEIELD